MQLGVTTYQDFVFGDTVAFVMQPPPAETSSDYEYEWWVMVDNRIRAQGGEDVLYSPRVGAGEDPIEPKTVTMAVIRQQESIVNGQVQIVKPRAVIAQRAWFAAGFRSRPQRNDILDSGQEKYVIEAVHCIGRRAPDGVVRDIKHKLELSGAGHRR